MCQFLLIFLVVITVSFSHLARADAGEESWPGGSRALLEQAKAQDGYEKVANMSPHFSPTGDGKSFVLVWYRGERPPRKWLVSLPGTHGYATRDLAVWSSVLSDRDIGFVSLQWWLGHGDGPRDYYSPFDIYRELDIALHRLGVSQDEALLQGFSRGAANVYAVAALDRSRGHRYFSTVIASSGGASLDYPATRDISNGKFGSSPFAGTRWITSCGERDQNPERDGCPAMRRTAEWLQGLGADVVLQIEDTAGGHGALNTNPENAAKALNLYMSKGQ